MEQKRSISIVLILLIIIFSLTISVSALQLKLDDRGEDVTEIQKYLKTLSYNISADGIFGKTTQEVVKKFQNENNLLIDGVVGENTYRLLKEKISKKVSYELYIVKRGDTLSDIARLKGVTVNKLKEFNNLDSAVIKTGQDIKIPKTKSMDEKKEKNSKIYYTVCRGDTLSSIAARRNLPVEEIMEANDLNSDFIKVGQEIVLPIANFKKSAAVNTKNKKSKNDNASKEIIHTVQRGDALSSIARMYGADVDRIRRNNNIEGDKIYAGDELIISNYQRGPFSLGRNSFIWPVNGRITSNFGWRNHPIKKTRLFHNGLDIAVSTGTSVKAAAAGEVVYSGWMNGFGYTIIIDHGQGVETLYAHNSRVTAAKGIMVNKGQQVAVSGNTGLSTGPHLHFGVLRNEKPLNPRDYLP